MYIFDVYWINMCISLYVYTYTLDEHWCPSDHDWLMGEASEDDPNCGEMLEIPHWSLEK